MEGEPGQCLYPGFPFVSFGYPNYRLVFQLILQLRPCRRLNSGSSQLNACWHDSILFFTRF
jgi:hypothetical protein